MAGEGIYLDLNKISKDINATTVLGKQIECIAQYWLDQKCYEQKTDDIYGECIQNMINEVRGGRYPNYEPWCSRFPAFIIIEASRMLGCGVPFPPDSQTSGNALKTFELARKRHKVDKNPTVGSFMFRASASSKNSGHWGVVVAIDGNKIITVEGNIKVNDSQEGVGSWWYDKSQISDIVVKSNRATSGMVFVHVEQYSCNATKSVEYKGQDCNYSLAAEKAKSEAEKKKHGYDITEYKSIWYELFGEEFPLPNDEKIHESYSKFYKDHGRYQTATEIKTTLKGIKTFHDAIKKRATDEQNKIDTANSKKLREEYKNTKDGELAPSVKKECEHILMWLPAKDSLPYYDLIQNRDVAADILTMPAHVYGGTNQARNGSAIKYTGTQVVPERPTGWGMFQDIPGNTIFITYNGSEASRFLLEQKLATSDPYVVTWDLARGNIVHARAFQFLTNDKYHSETRITLSESIYQNGILKNQIYNEAKRWKFGKKFRDENGNKRSEWTPLTVLNAIQDIGQKFDRPFIMHIVETKRPSNWDNLGKALSMASSMLGQIPVIGMAASALSGAVNVIADLDAGRPVNIMQAAQSLGKAANWIIPEEVKGLGQKYFNDAKSFVDDAFKDNFQNLSIERIAKSIGVNPKAVNAIVQKYKRNTREIIVDITEGLESTLEGASKHLANFNNMLLIDNISRAIESGELATKISQSPFFTNVSIVQDVFIAGNAETVLAAMPGNHHIFKALLTNDRKYQSEIMNRPQGNDIYYAMMLSSFGYPAPKGAYDELVVESLIDKFSDTKFGKIVLPPSITEDKKECYTYALKETLPKEVEIIMCNQGWIWDKYLRKCVKDDYSFGTGGYESSSEKIIREKVKIETKEELPNCIFVQGGKYWYRSRDGQNLPAFKGVNLDAGKWFALISGKYLTIKDCIIVRPDIEIPPSGDFTPEFDFTPRGDFEVVPEFEKIPKGKERIPEFYIPRDEGGITIGKEKEKQIFRREEEKITRKEKLPKCIIVSGGKYYYDPNWNRVAPSNAALISKNPPPIELEEKPIDKVLFDPISTSSFAGPSKNKATQIKAPVTPILPTFTGKQVNNLMKKDTPKLPLFSNNNVEYAPGFGSQPTFNLPSKFGTFVSDGELLPAFKGQGADLGKWFVMVNGGYIELINCEYAKVETPEFERTPEFEKIPEREETPTYDKTPRRKVVPRREETPTYDRIPKTKVIPRREDVPTYDIPPMEFPKNKIVPEREDIPPRDTPRPSTRDRPEDGGLCPDCPKMETTTTKRIYEYPGCDEGCCNED